MAALLVTLSFVLYLLNMDPAAVGPRSVSNIQAAAAALGLLFGTIGTFAGAIASLNIAALGLRVSQAQERIAAVSFLEDRFSRAASAFAEIALSVGELYADGVALDVRLPSVDRESVSKLMNEKLPEELRDETDRFANSLERLAKAQRAIALDDFASACFARGLARGGAMSPKLSRELVALGAPESEVAMSVDNLADFKSLLEMAATNVRDHTWSRMLTARLAANASEIPAMNKSYDNRSVRSLFVIGNLILNRTEQLQTGKLCVAALGAAMIHDIARCLPTSEDMRATLAELYPENARHVAVMRTKFDARSLVSSYLLKALNDADQIGGLYLLKGA